MVVVVAVTGHNIIPPCIDTVTGRGVNGKITRLVIGDDSEG